VDPISHAVIGSAVAALVPEGTHPAVVWGILIGAEVPDIDFVVRYFKGRAGYLKLHRGPTHGLIALPVYALLISMVLHFIAPGAPFWTLFLWTLAGGLSHVLFDFGNDYGTQGFWPFSSRKVALDIIPIVDLGLFGLIGGGWIMNGLWTGHRQVIFIGVWLLIAAYVGLRYLLRLKAFRIVKAHFELSDLSGEYAQCGPDWREERITVHAALVSLNVWRYVVQMEGEFLLGMVRISDGQVTEPQRAVNQMDRIVKASMQSSIVTLFSRWARRPRVEVRQEQGLYHVQWTDVRYQMEDFSPFKAYAWLDEHLDMVDEGLASQKPGEMGREKIWYWLQRESGRI
jgi:inner membrane protein